MKRFILALAFLFLGTPAFAANCVSPLTGNDAGGTSRNFGVTLDASNNCYGNVALVDGTNAANKATVTAAGALKVDGSAVTQPVSLTSTTITGSVAVTNAGTFATQLTGATNNINNIAGTITLPTGAATSANQGLLTTWAGGTLGAMANYGTSPGAVLVPGINAFVTNALTSVNDNADGVAVATPYGSPVVAHNYAFNGTTWDRVPIVAKSAAPTTAGNQALVVDLRPDSPGIIALGPATAANSVPMTIGPTVLGSYCMGANTGTMAAGLAGGSPIYSFRYGGANIAIVRKVIVEADNITTAFVAGAAKVDLIAARSFSASDTGGTAATLTGNNGKLRTSYATTAISDLRIASTATLTAGTRTLDAQPLASVEFAVPTSIDADLLPTTALFQANVGEQPLILANNEGFVVQATVPGTGTWVGSVRTCWDEVTAF